MPVGVPLVFGTDAMVAVSVSDCPYKALLAEVVNVVVVDWVEGVTSWVIAAEVLPLKFRPSLAYTAVIVWLPTVRSLESRRAVPLPSKVTGFA